MTKLNFSLFYFVLRINFLEIKSQNKYLMTKYPINAKKKSVEKNQK